MKKYYIILASDLNGGIGNNNKIPWKFITDITYFKNLTISNVYLNLITVKNILIMGHNTFKSLNNKPLQNRLSFVISKDYINLNNKNTNNDIKYFENFITAYNETIKYIQSEIWVIGGVTIYEQALMHYGCDKIYYTKINNKFTCDKFIDINKYNIKWINNITLEDLNIYDNNVYLLTFYQGYNKFNIEIKYLELLNNVLLYGNTRNTRNSITISKFNNKLSCNLKYGFPLLTTKKMFWKGIVEELIFFIRGDTNTNILKKKGIKIWEGNTTKEFINKMGLDYDEGIMGPMYGYQWRFFNKKYNNDNEKGIDQLKYVIEELKTNPTSRRILMTCYNPEQVNEGVLFPCHSIIIQFYVEDKNISCNMYQRSADLFLGLPFNIASTSLLLNIIGKLTNLEPYKVNLLLGDYHIYRDHIDAIKEQLTRIPNKLPKLKMKDFKDLEDIENSSYLDYIIEDYKPYPLIKAPLII